MLNDRAQHILKVLVERYIHDGQPVGSRALSKDFGLDLSPASIRNVMADLEDFGLIRAPHTSAGRVPTAAGYRLFIESLLTVKPLRSSIAREIEQTLAGEHDAPHIVGRASEILSGITSLASVVMFPRRESTVLRQIEFLPLADRRVLVILVTNEQEVQNQIIETQRDYSASELEQAGHYLTESFSGQDLPAIRSLMLEELQDAREHLNQLMLDALEIGRQAFDETAAADDYVVSGETNLMQFDDLADMERLRQLFESFRAKHEILRLLEACMSTERAHIFIGEESGYDVFDECSVVTAPYSREGRIVGILGVIGPTRMEYQKVIPLVDLTAKLVGAALKSR